MDTDNWLDVLTDGQLMRAWGSLVAHFFLGLGYYTVLFAGFGFAIGTIPILIGLPMFLFMLAATRTLADADQRLIGALMDVDTRPMADDVDPTGANFGQRLGLYLGSLTTWRSAAYLLLKLPLGSFTLMLAMAALPLLAFEMLILAPLGIDLRLLSPRLTRWVALAAHRVPGYLLPRQSVKRKRSFEHLETSQPEAEEFVYLIEDDGEVVPRRKRA